MWIAVNYIKNKIWGTSKICVCRLCKTNNETVQHITSACKCLAQTQYLYRHNQVAKYIHWNILQDNNVQVPNNWLKQCEEKQ